ncbi:MAG: hypothetical protein GX247_04255 [Mollicutes bacterium]|nr:hypothetical protein [Mollicutes bacterium]
MRQSHQILVFPYKKDEKGNYLYGIFCRVGKTERWQGIAGGVEEVSRKNAKIYGNKKGITSEMLELFKIYKEKI